MKTSKAKIILTGDLGPLMITCWWCGREENQWDAEGWRFGLCPSCVKEAYDTDWLQTHQDYCTCDFCIECNDQLETEEWTNSNSTSTA
jgi:NMD protein affecting ribosome stability and mRNA decay